MTGSRKCLLNLFIGRNFKFFVKKSIHCRPYKPELRNIATETNHLVNKSYRAVYSNPFTYWSVDRQKVQQESKNRVNLTSIPIFRINDYLIVPFKNELKEYRIYVFWILEVARKALEGSKSDRKKLGINKN